MIFEKALAAQVMAGEKTVTRRACTDNPRSPWFVDKCSMARGKVVKVNPGRGITNIGEIRVIGVMKERLGDVFPTDEAGEYEKPADVMAALGAHLEALAEGFAGAAEFVAGWREINGSWNPDTLVWRIAFEVVA